VAVQLAASQEGLSSVELVIYQTFHVALKGKEKKQQIYHTKFI
jgi:hypothetical protein